MVRVLLLLLAQLETGLEIETNSPDAMCPDLTQTREAVAARLGTLKVTGSGWRARYTIGHAPDSAEGDFVRLELWDPKGTLRLTRDLPVGAGSCAGMAHAIALVIERYFSTLLEGNVSAFPPADEAGTRTEEEPPPNGPRTPPTNELRPPPSIEAAPPPEAPASIGPAKRIRIGVLGGYAVDMLGSQISFETRLGRSEWIGLSGLVSWRPQKEEYRGESVELHSFPLRAWLGFGWSTHRYWLNAGPEILLAFERAVAPGLEDGEGATRAVPGLGATSGVGLRLGSTVGLGLRASLDLAPPMATHEFVVDAEDAETIEVFEPTWVKAAFGGGLFLHF